MTIPQTMWNALSKFWGRISSVEHVEHLKRQLKENDQQLDTVKNLKDGECYSSMSVAMFLRDKNTTREEPTKMDFDVICRKSEHAFCDKAIKEAKRFKKATMTSSHVVLMIEEVAIPMNRHQVAKVIRHCS